MANFKNVFPFFLFLVVAVPVATGDWSDTDEERELITAIRALNDSVDIARTIQLVDEQYNKIVQSRTQKMIDQPEQVDFNYLADQLLKQVQEKREKAVPFAERFQQLLDRLSFVSIYRRFQCMAHKAEVEAMNQTLAMVQDNLVLFRTQQIPLPDSVQTKSFVHKKLLDFTNEYPSYARIDYLLDEFKFLDQELREFYSKNTTELKQVILGRLTDVAQTADAIKDELRRIYQESIQFGRQQTPQEQLPVKLDYNIQMLARLYKVRSQQCRQFHERIQMDLGPNGAGSLPSPSFFAVFLTVLIVHFLSRQ